MALNPNAVLQDPSLLSSIGTQTLSGLEYVGGLLDKLTAARAVRGGLDGNYNELLSVIPGSDTFGLTNPEDSVSGRQLLENYGALAPNEPGLDWGDVGGFAAEVALDPTAWASLGATTAAKRLLPTTATAGLEGLGRAATAPTRFLAKGLNDFPLIGGAPDFLSNMPGGRVGQFAGDLLSGGVKGGVVDPLLDTDTGRALKAIFNSDYRGATTSFGQGNAMGLTRNLEESRAAVRGDTARYKNLLEQHGLLNEKSAPDLRRALEGITDGIDPKIVHVAGIMREDLGPLLEDLVGNGVSRGALDDLMDFFPRKYEDPSGASRPSTGKAFNTQDPFNLSRKKYLKGIRGGTEQLKDIIRDPLIMKASDSKQAGLYILKKYADKLPPYKMSDDFKQVFDTYEQNGKLGMNAVAAILKKEEKAFKVAKKADKNALPSSTLLEARSIQRLRRGRATKMAGWIRDSMTDDARNVGYFDRHPIVDLEDYRVRMRGVNEAANSVVNATSYALKELNFKPTATDKGMSVNDILKKARMNRNHNAKIKIGQSLGLDMTDPKMLKKNLSEVGRMRIASKEADDLVGMVNSFTRPKAAGEVAKLWDSYTSLFKAGVLTWPSRYVRDATSGTYFNAIRGVRPSDYHDTINLISKDGVASKILNFGDSSGVIKGAAKAYGEHPAIKEILDAQGLPHNDENITQALKDLIYKYEVASPRQQDLAGGDITAGGTLSDKLGEFVGNRQFGAKSVLNKLDPRIPGALNPLNNRGVRKVGGEVRDKSDFALTKAGEELAYGVEAMNRIPMFLRELKKGTYPLEAAKIVREMHVDYRPEAFSAAERGIRKFIPFYSWYKGMLPHVAKQLTEHPGGGIAQSIRAQRNLTQDEGGFVPQDLRRQTSFLAPDFITPDDLPAGTSRFVTGFGLPQENVLENFVVKQNPDGTISPGSTIAATLQRSAAMLHPAIKGAIETATGTNLYTGRQLQDLDSPTERLVKNLTGSETFQMPMLMDTILQNSPATRALNTARQFTDPRDPDHSKFLTNFFSGVRLSDVDLAKRAEIEVREQAVEGIGDQAKTFRSVYVPRKTLEQLQVTDPEWMPGGSKRNLLDLYQSMNQ